MMVARTRMGKEAVVAWGFTFQIYAGGNTHRVFRWVAYEMRD